MVARRVAGLADTLALAGTSVVLDTLAVVGTSSGAVRHYQTSPG